MLKIFMGFVLVFSFVSMQAQEISWFTDYDEALKQAKEKKQLILIDFTASWCGPCKFMERTTFKDENVLKLLQGYTMLKVDFDTNTQLVGRFNVSSIPNLIVLNPNAKILGEQVGYQGPSELLAWLGAVTKDLDMATLEIRDLEKEFESAFKHFQDFTLEAKIEGIRNYFVLMHSKDDQSLKELSEKWLRKIAMEYPELMIDYMNSDLLENRVFVHNLFLQKIPDAREKFDPWASKEARKKSFELILKSFKESK